MQFFDRIVAKRGFQCNDSFIFLTYFGYFQKLFFTFFTNKIRFFFNLCHKNSSKSNLKHTIVNNLKLTKNLKITLFFFFKKGVDLLFISVIIKMKDK